MCLTNLLQMVNQAQALEELSSLAKPILKSTHFYKNDKEISLFYRFKSAGVGGS